MNKEEISISPSNPIQSNLCFELQFRKFSFSKFCDGATTRTPPPNESNPIRGGRV
jgi:hypothetical protein